MARFAKGQSGNPAGRPKGIPNKMSRNAREAVQQVFEELGGTEAMKAWAVENPNEFFKLYGRLLPLEVTGPEGGGLIVQIVSLAEAQRALPADE